MCLSLATEIFNALGYGVSIVVGIGGDRITGTNFRDLLELVRDDPGTSLVILNGEVGGDYEEEAAAYIQASKYPKPVVARLTGIGVQNIFPRGSRMGHAGAIIGEGRFGTYESKLEAFEKAGVSVAKTSEDLIAFVERAMPRRAPDFETPVTKEFELVSISKAKLENLKSQVRAVQLRTHLTKIADGTPYFRGRPLPQLMRRASVPQIVFEAVLQEDADEPRAAQTARDLVLCATTCPAGDLRPQCRRRFPARRIADQRGDQRRVVSPVRRRDRSASRRLSRAILAHSGRGDVAGPASDRPGGLAWAMNYDGTTAVVSSR